MRGWQTSGPNMCLGLKTLLAFLHETCLVHFSAYKHVDSVKTLSTIKIAFELQWQSLIEKPLGLTATTRITI